MAREPGFDGHPLSGAQEEERRGGLAATILRRNLDGLAPPSRSLLAVLQEMVRAKKQAIASSAKEKGSRGPFRRSREKGTGEKLAVSSQGKHLSALKSFFRFLAREGKLLVDMATGLVLPKRRKLLPQALINPKAAIRLCESVGGC